MKLSIILWVVPPPRMPVANEGFFRDPLLKMFHNPGGDCYWEGGQPKSYSYPSHFGYRNFRTSFKTTYRRDGVFLRRLDSPFTKRHWHGQIVPKMHRWTGSKVMSKKHGVRNCTEDLQQLFIPYLVHPFFGQCT